MPQSVLQNATFLSGLDVLNNGTQSILDIFVIQGLVTSKDADSLKRRYKSNRQVEEVLLKNQIVSRDTINKAYSILLKIPYVSIENFKIAKDALSLIPESFAKTYGVIPFGYGNGIVQIALCRPSDLNSNYAKNLDKLLKQKHLGIEIFITGQKDYESAIRQYRGQKDNLLETASFPTVFLRNQDISANLLGKFPIDFIKKFRAIIFFKKNDVEYAVAAETPDDPIFRKAISEIEIENKVKIQIFATSKLDIDYGINSYIKKLEKHTEPVKKAMPEVKVRVNEEESEKKKKEEKDDIITFSNLFSSFASKKDNGPILTIDSKESLAPESVDQEVSDEKSKVVVPEMSDKEKKDESDQSKKIKDDKATEEGSIVKIEKKDSKDVEILVDEDIGSLINEDINDIEDLKKIAQENYIPKTVAAIINLALKFRASDIHIEPEQKKLRVRYRVDGILKDIMNLPLSVHPPIASRVKILGKLKLDETRIPQDGRFDVMFKNHEVDVRVSALPTVHGEKIVMRILDKTQGILSLEDLGMKGRAFDLTIEAMGKPYGVILSTGPTGSGKSTTLYAIINRISSPSVNIVTLEDPVEYEIAGVNQCQVKPSIGFTFAEGLRSVLRQDPNVIMVGEIRDGETAGMATHAALTGHLVLTTLHTNDASGALPRLINMGVEPFLITSSINLVIAQRLVRRICPKCSTEMKIPEVLLARIKAELDKIPKTNKQDLARIPQVLKFYHGVGCSECENGFKGRVGIFEVLRMTDGIEALAVGKKTSNEIREAAIADGMITIMQDGILKTLEGLTTIDEIFNATSSN